MLLRFQAVEQGGQTLGGEGAVHLEIRVQVDEGLQPRLGPGLGLGTAVIQHGEPVVAFRQHLGPVGLQGRGPGRQGLDHLLEADGGALPIALGGPEGFGLEEAVFECRILRPEVDPEEECEREEEAEAHISSTG